MGSGTYEHLQAKEQAERVREAVARYVTKISGFNVEDCAVP